MKYEFKAINFAAVKYILLILLAVTGYCPYAQLTGKVIKVADGDMFTLLTGR